MSTRMPFPPSKGFMPTHLNAFFSDASGWGTGSLRFMYASHASQAVAAAEALATTRDERPEFNEYISSNFPMRRLNSLIVMLLL